jgi:rhamnogalacturonyl hydrolase YesR
MRKVVSWLLGCTLSVVLQAQPATVYDPELNLRIAAHRVQQGERTIRYRPDGNDLVIHNGKGKFNRALYGTHTGFRVETGDVPEFALYLPRLGGNLSFSLSNGARAVSLNALSSVESRYRPGTRMYTLRDPLLGSGELKLQVLAYAEGEGMIVRIEAGSIPDGLTLLARFGGASDKRFSREGDLGVDPADSFDFKAANCKGNEYELSGTGFVLKFGANGMRTLTGGFPAGARLKLDEAPSLHAELPLSKKKAYLIWIQVPDAGSSQTPEKRFEEAENRRKAISSKLQITTPDEWISPLGGIISAAADGIWDGQVWLHGAVGWRMPLAGWRAAYTGDVMGWHDRARTHFEAYAASQVTEVPVRLQHPYQDSALNLARSAKVWGTPMYSNGYIGRNPRRNDQMHHYDMNLAYIDELLWHLNWTGDLEFARKVWPVLKSHLAWEKLNFDPDGDGLYNAYACIWASDALYYNSGGVTHSSAYNHRANRMAAKIARLLGNDARPYEQEAEKILKAVNQRLWLPHCGHWAEFVDFMGHKMTHENAAIWTIYHAIDGDLHTPEQAWQATRYIDREIPHIAVNAKGLPENTYKVISTTSWMPYSWSINNVALAEIYHTALAYWQAGRNEAAFHLLKSAVLDNMYLGQSPGNIGQISHYDAARGECYRDFGDPVGILSRTIVQGLYGILPDALHGELTIKPGFPAEWNHASVNNGTVQYSFQRQKNKTVYKFAQQFNSLLKVKMVVPLSREKLLAVKVDGRKARYSLDDQAVGRPLIIVEVPASKSFTLELVEDGNLLNLEPEVITTNDKKLSANTEFKTVTQGDIRWKRPVYYELNTTETVKVQPSFTRVNAAYCEPLNLDTLLNAEITHIFREQYFTPRSPYTTLQIPVQGIGEWCHPKLTAEIDDSGLRSASPGNRFEGPAGIPFRSMQQGNNVSFVSLWDNYPDQIAVPLSGSASRAYLLMAGSTNHMQFDVDNGWIVVEYTEGTPDTVRLRNPDNWCPIEQDFYIDGKAFQLKGEPHWRVHLKTGKISQQLGKELGISGVYGRSIPGGAGILLDIALDSTRMLKKLKLEARANEVVIGLVGLTLQRLSFDQETLAVRFAESEMKRFPEAWQLDHGKRLFFGYSQGLGAKAMLEVWKRTGDRKYYDYVYKWADTIVNDRGEIYLYDKESYNIDFINSGKVLLELYQHEPREKWRLAIEDLIDQLKKHPRTSPGGYWHKKIYPHQMWLDGIYMASPFMAAYGKQFKQKNWVDEAIHQVVLCYQKCVDSKTGLLHHAWDESRSQRWADKRTGQSSTHWGRSMGWYMMAVVDVLDFVPENHPRRKELISIIRKMAEVLPAYRGTDGLWYQVVDQVERPGNYPEPSVNAQLLYAISKSVNKGFLAEEYRNIAQEVLKSMEFRLLKKEKDETISLVGCCAVAGLGGNPYRDGSFEYYINERRRDNDAKATGPFIMACLELNFSK